LSAAAPLSPIIFAELAVIMASAQGAGWLAKRYLGQPRVVGEMIAGVVLGPSILGQIAPGLQTALFPADARAFLYVLAQFGVGLYMFIVGLSFRTGEFRSHARSAAAVSLSGMAAPFLLAMVVTPVLMARPGLFGASINTLQATLFIGAAIAITAFPMLARMIHERGLYDTPLGTLALSAGAIDDAAAWAVLAIVLASLGDDSLAAVKAIGGGLAFALFAVVLGRRLLAPLGRRAERSGVGAGLLGVTLSLFALAAGAMDVIGIHAVFGGFLLGAVMPRGRFAEEVKRQIEPFTVVVLLPLFFTFSGLNTRLTLLNDVGLIGVTAIVLVASVLAKGGGCYLAARLSGQDHGSALALGGLMNSRGLMELIIINIGLQRGVISPTLFSILVLMALITTIMASPLFEYGLRQSRRSA
jgi:Kef-type K+ transport system membrane component KefB